MKFLHKLFIVVLVVVCIACENEVRTPYEGLEHDVAYYEQYTVDTDPDEALMATALLEKYTSVQNNRFVLDSQGFQQEVQSLGLDKTLVSKIEGSVAQTNALIAEGTLKPEGIILPGTSDISNINVVSGGGGAWGCEGTNGVVQYTWGAAIYLDSCKATDLIFLIKMGGGVVAIAGIIIAVIPGGQGPGAITGVVGVLIYMGADTLDYIRSKGNGGLVIMWFRNGSVLVLPQFDGPVITTTPSPGPTPTPTLTPPPPSLICSGISGPANPNSGEFCTYSVTVTNTGSAASGNFSVLWTIDGSTHCNQTMSLNAGASGTSSCTMQMYYGSHTIRVGIHVSEASECAGLDIYVNDTPVVTPTPPPEIVRLSCSGVSGPGNPWAGEYCTYSVTVTNTGTIASGSFSVVWTWDGGTRCTSTMSLGPGASGSSSCTFQVYYGSHTIGASIQGPGASGCGGKSIYVNN